MVDYNYVLAEKHYRSVPERAAKYYQETAKTTDIPTITPDIPDCKEYTWVSFTDPQAGHATLEWSGQGKIGDVMHTSTTYKLLGQELHLQFPFSEIQNLGSALIADKRDAIIAKYALDIDDSFFHGPKSDAGIQMQEGLIGQLTSMEDLNGTDSNLATKGYIWKAINKMIDGIPFAMREEGPEMILFMDELVYKNATAPDRIYQDKVEWNFIYEMLMGEMAIKGRKIGKVIVTNKILAEASDDTDGDNADTDDTLGTHSRMLLIVPDSRWIGKVISRSFSFIDEEKVMPNSVHQLYGFRGGCFANNTDCAEYTEQLVWA
jgi:hypothetical protein